MDAEPATPDAFLIFRSGGCPPALQTLCTQQRKPRFVSRAERTPGRYVSIQLHARACHRCRHQARAPEGARNHRSGDATATSRSAPGIRRCLSHSGSSVPKTWPARAWDGTRRSFVRSPAEAGSRRQRISRTKRATKTTITIVTAPFPPDRPAPHDHPKANRCSDVTPAAPGLPLTVSRKRHPDTAADLHRGERSRKTLSTCQLPRTPNLTLQPCPRSGFPFLPLHYAPSGPMLECRGLRRTKTRTRRKHASTPIRAITCSALRTRASNAQSSPWRSFLCKTRDTDHNPSTGFPHQAASCRTRETSNPCNSLKSKVLRLTRH